MQEYLLKSKQIGEINDLVSIFTCFSAKLYGARGGRKLKQTVENTLQKLETEKKKERGENSENNNESNSS